MVMMASEYESWRLMRAWSNPRCKIAFRVSAGCGQIMPSRQMGGNGAGKRAAGAASCSGLARCGKSWGGRVRAQQPVDRLDAARMAAFEQNRPRTRGKKT